MNREDTALLNRWPILATQPQADWPRRAAHLYAAAEARAKGEPCPVCPTR